MPCIRVVMNQNYLNLKLKTRLKQIFRFSPITHCCDELKTQLRHLLPSTINHQQIPLLGLLKLAERSLSCIKLHLKGQNYGWVFKSTIDCVYAITLSPAKHVLPSSAKNWHPFWGSYSCRNWAFTVFVFVEGSEDDVQLLLVFAQVVDELGLASMLFKLFSAVAEARVK